MPAPASDAAFAGVLAPVAGALAGPVPAGVAGANMPAPAGMTESGVVVGGVAWLGAEGG